MARTDDNENFTEEERQAMKDRAKETRTARSRKKKTPEEVRAEGEAELRAKLDELSGDDRAIGEALHRLVTENAPSLIPRTYYGMPAWAKDGKVLCFFQPASKFKVRYATFGFETGAALDDGNVWPTSFAVTKLDAADETFFAEVIRRAVG
jgi:uncharacterized protein YdhG (YjbR/CyaY superfamily)